MIANLPVVQGKYLAGAPNFRDFGGYRLPDGQMLRRNRLYRSDGLGLLTETDLKLISLLGIRMVCDFRDEAERKKKPSRWPVGDAPEWMLLNISSEKMGAPFTTGLNADAARLAMIDMYRTLPALLAPGLGQLCRRLAEGCVPVVVHCTAGKDRTGIVCASILRLLGVSERDFYADYMASDHCSDKLVLADHLGKQLQALLGEPPTPETVDALISVSPEYLNAAFEAMALEFGSFESYIEHGAGIDRRLRAQLLAVVTA